MLIEHPSPAVDSSALRLAKALPAIADAIDLRVPLLLIAPRGPGIELIARAVHALSSRCDGPFTTVRCGLYPGPSLQKRFFGEYPTRNTRFRRIAPQPGHAQRADGGTLFIEQLQYTTPLIQDALSHMLDRQPWTNPTTGEQCLSDVRIIATASHQTAAYVQRGRLSGTLYRRLQTATAQLPEAAASVDGLLELLPAAQHLCTHDHPRRQSQASPTHGAIASLAAELRLLAESDHSASATVHPRFLMAG